MADDGQVVLQSGIKEKIAGSVQRIKPVILRLQFQNPKAILIAAAA